MAHGFSNRVWCDTATTGTGNVTIGTVRGAHCTPADAGTPDGADRTWLLEEGDDFEIFRGAYTSAGTVVTRGTVLLSQIAGVTGKTRMTLAGAATIREVVAAEDMFAANGHLFGLTLSTAGSSATFGIAAGQAADSTNSYLMALASAYTKTTGAWAVGSGNGALDTGTIANNTWYKVYEIKRLDTGVTDVAITTNALATGPTFGGNIPSAYTIFRYLGSMKTNGSAQWIKFIQDDDLFTWDTPVNDVAAVNPGTSAVTRTLSVPTGVRVEASIFVGALATAANADLPLAIYISDLSTADMAAYIGAAATIECYAAGSASPMALGGMARVMTNTSSQVRSRLQVSTAGTTLYIITYGWRDRRGRDA